MEDTQRSALILGVLLAVGASSGGYFIGNGLLRARATQRYVTVRGLSERDVPANLAMWPIAFTATADDLGELQRRIDRTAKQISEFLARDFDPDEFALSVPSITDHSLRSYPSDRRPPERYAAEATITLRTRKIEAVREAMRRSGELVKNGVPLVPSREYRTQFLFTELERIKPEMIAAATRDARRAAEQFATDSGSTVGAIRNAQQGYFSIQDRDPFSPEHKRVRVVTTVQYFLVDE